MLKAINAEKRGWTSVKKAEKSCRIAVADEKCAKMLRAALILGGIECSDDGQLSVTDDITRESDNASAIILITASDDIPESNIPLTVVRTPICFEELIETAKELLCAADEPFVSDAPKTETSAEVSEITVYDGCVSYRGKTAQLTDRELLLFEYLRRREGQTVSRRELFEEVWSEASGDTNVTDVYISYLRRKLKPVFGEGILISVRGQGYILKLP